METLAIEITPEMDDRLRQEAERRGVSREELARTLVEQRFKANVPPLTPAAPGAWKTALRDWVASHEDLPALPPDAFRRDSMYGGGI